MCSSEGFQSLSILRATPVVQGSYLLAHPEAFDAMFWKSLPRGTFWPMFVVATLAAIIASQALISAVFQIVSQAIVQGFFPRFHVHHTSREVSPSLCCTCFRLAITCSCLHNQVSHFNLGQLLQKMRLRMIECNHRGKACLSCCCNAILLSLGCHFSCSTQREEP